MSVPSGSLVLFQLKKKRRKRDVCRLCGSSYRNICQGVETMLTAKFMAVARAMPVLYPLRATPYFEIEEIRRRATMCSYEKIRLVLPCS